MAASAINPKILWAQLHTLRMDFNRRIEEIKRQLLELNLSSDSTSLLRGIDLVRSEFEEYKFKQLAVVCFFESSFKRFNNSSSKIRSTSIQNVPAPQSTSTNTAKEPHQTNLPEQEDLFALQLRQQQIMSGITVHWPDEQQPSGQDAADTLQEELLAGIDTVPSGSKPGPTARDYEFVRSNLPVLCALTNSASVAPEATIINPDDLAHQLDGEGFFDLLHQAGAVSDADFGITEPQSVAACSSSSSSSSSTGSDNIHAAFGLDQVIDEELDFKRNSGSSCSTNSLSVHSHPPQNTPLRPHIKYTSSRVRARSDELKYARGVCRKDLLKYINQFLSNFGVSPIQKRDKLWTDWFLGEYLQLSPDERNSSHSLLVLDKRDSSTFIEAVRRLYMECCVSSSTHRRTSPAQDQNGTTSDEPQKKKRVWNQGPGHDQETVGPPGNDSSEKQSGPSLMFSKPGSVVVLRPLFGGV